MFSTSEDGIGSLIFSWLDVAENSFLQLLRGSGYIRAIHQIGFGEDTRQVLGDGKAVAVVAFLLSQLSLVDDAQSRHNRTGINYLLHLGSDDVGI